MSKSRSTLTRLEWLFPMRGRWLRCLLSAGVLLGALWYVPAFRPSLPTIADAASGIEASLSPHWGFWSVGGISMSGHTVHSLKLGPLHVSWVARWWGDLWRTALLRFVLDAAVLAAVAKTLLWLWSQRRER